jgi:hypothetical protein
MAGRQPLAPPHDPALLCRRSYYPFLSGKDKENHMSTAPIAGPDADAGLNPAAALRARLRAQAASESYDAGRSATAFSEAEEYADSGSYDAFGNSPGRHADQFGDQFAAESGLGDVEDTMVASLIEQLEALYAERAELRAATGCTNVDEAIERVAELRAHVATLIVPARNRIAEQLSALDSIGRSRS